MIALHILDTKIFMKQFLVLNTFDRWNLSEGTIRNSLSVILSKLGLKNRTQLGIWAVQTDTAARMYDSDEE